MNLYIHWRSQGDVGPTGRDGSSGDPVRDPFVFTNRGISSSAELKLCWCVSIWPELCFFNRVQEDHWGLKERRYPQNCYLFSKCINPVYSPKKTNSSDSWIKAIIDYRNLKKKKNPDIVIYVKKNIIYGVNILYVVIYLMYLSSIPDKSVRNII